MVLLNSAIEKTVEKWTYRVLACPFVLVSQPDFIQFNQILRIPQNSLHYFYFLFKKFTQEAVFCTVSVFRIRISIFIAG